jgi:hypothetical protein
MKRILLTLSISTFSLLSFAQWSRISNFQDTARSDAFTFSLFGKAYYGTGMRWDPVYDASGTLIDSKLSYLKDFWEYNPSFNSWTRKADFPGHERSSICSFSIAGKGYAGLGYYRAGHPTATYHPNDFWMYDPTTDVWSRKADFPGTQRTDPVFFSVGTKAYICLGWAGVYYLEVWEYDTQTDSWTRKNDFPGVWRGQAIGFELCGKGYIGAGNDDMNNKRRDFWQYDPLIDQWLQIADMPDDFKIDPEAFVVNNLAYVGTGWSYDVGRVSSDFLIYDPVVNTWTAFPDTLPCDLSNTYWAIHGSPSLSHEGRTQASAIVIGNTAIVGGGHGNNIYDYYKDFYSYSFPALTTAVSQNDAENGISVSPNPGNSIFVLTYSGETMQDAFLRVYNSLGQCVYSKTVKARGQQMKEPIDLSSYGKGFYNLEFIADGKRYSQTLILD